MQKSQLKASVHEQDSRNHGDINCLGKHSFQNKMIAPMKEGGGFRKVILFLYYSGISDPQCTHFDYTVPCYDIRN